MKLAVVNRRIKSTLRSIIISQVSLIDLWTERNRWRCNELIDKFKQNIQYIYLYAGIADQTEPTTVHCQSEINGPLGSFHAIFFNLTTEWSARSIDLWFQLPLFAHQLLFNTAMSNNLIFYCNYKIDSFRSINFTVIRIQDQNWMTRRASQLNNISRETLHKSW